MVIRSSETPAIGRGLVRALGEDPALGLDPVVLEDLAGVEGDDRDLLLIDDGQDPAAGVGRADPQVVHPSWAPQADRTLLVGGVVPEV